MFKSCHQISLVQSTLFINQEQLQVTEHEIPNYYMQNMAADKETHWQLDASGEFISCHIENNPLGASLNLDPATFWNSKKEQYVIHIHGLVSGISL